MKNKHLTTILACVTMAGSSQAALTQLFVTNTNGDIAGVTESGGIATGGDTSHTYSFTSVVADGVTFDLSFDMTATGGYLRGNNSTMGIHSSAVAETSNGNGRNQVGIGEVLAFDNITISNVSGGTIQFEGIQRLLYNVADENGDAGTVTAVGDNTKVLSWSQLSDYFDVATEFTNDGGLGIISEISVTATGDDFRFGGLEMTFTGTAIPEPSSSALLGLGGLALILRRRK